MEIEEVTPLYDGEPNDVNPYFAYVMENYIKPALEYGVDRLYMPPRKPQLHGVRTAPLPLENRSSIMIVAHGSVTTNIRRSWYDRLSGNIAAS